MVEDEAAVPMNLRSFLEAAKLPQLEDQLVKHGYDDVDDFAAWGKTRGACAATW